MAKVIQHFFFISITSPALRYWRVSGKYPYDVDSVQVDLDLKRVHCPSFTEREALGDDSRAIIWSCMETRILWIV